MQKAVFIFLHYLGLMTFIFSCWGIGTTIASRGRQIFYKDESLENTLVVVCGIGILICLLQLLAIAGLLSFNYIVLLLGAGVLSAGAKLYTGFRDSGRSGNGHQQLSIVSKLSLLIVSAYLLSTVFKPLRPPMEWDEVMYHLPHAAEWARTGHLTVNEWLRYPWFPYNFELLYAAALVVWDDVMPHMLHSAAGWLTAFLLYKFSKRYFGFFVAVIATIFWLWLAKGYFDNAQIDMGLTLFIFSACIAFYFWIEDRQKTNWLLMASFFMGLATGSKYQTLMFLPPFFFALLILERHWRILLKVMFCFLLPCIYWYSRNAILTGDPFDPMGGKLFGFHDWNLEDFKYQFLDLNNVKGWPSWVLWSAPLALLSKDIRSGACLRSIMIFCVYSVLVWMVTSHYPRYLLPVYPLLAILAAIGWLFVINGICRFIPARFRTDMAPKFSRYKVFVLILLLVSSSVEGLTRAVSSLKLVAYDQQSRDKILADRISGYEVLAYQKNHVVGKTYQFGLEDSIYYAPQETWGDHFGPGRYRDLKDLPPAELSAKLKALGFHHLLIHTKRWPGINSASDFDCYFEKIYGADSVILYTINRASQC